MKLITMTDFVLEQRKIHDGDFKDLSDLYFRYAKFLKQPLELWMFVPCLLTGGYNVVLDKAKCNVCGVTMGDYCGRSKECAQSNENEFFIYKNAKERCLFEGFELDCASMNLKIIRSEFMPDFLISFLQKEKLTIEDLVKHNLKLTKTAIKQLGL